MLLIRFYINKYKINTICHRDMYQMFKENIPKHLPVKMILPDDIFTSVAARATHA